MCVQAAPIFQLASIVRGPRFEQLLGYRVVAKSLPDDLNAATLWRSAPYGLTLLRLLMATDHPEEGFNSLIAMYLYLSYTIQYG